jgi:hypothetical protein
MVQMKLLMRCSSCGAQNRLRLVTGKKVRVRCGFCGELLPATTGRILILTLGRGIKSFFVRALPLALIFFVDLITHLLKTILYPLKRLWRIFPERIRLRLAWTFIIALMLSYMAVQGTIKLSSLLILSAVLTLVAIVMALSLSGPGALAGMARHLAGRILRTCPSCGHRYFGWLKCCPRCNG